MAVFLRQAFPVPIDGPVGSSVTLRSLLVQAFGENADLIPGGWISYYGSEAMQAWNFSYVNPSNPSVTQWRIGGSPVTASTPTTFNQPYVTASHFGSVDARIGNMFCPQTYLTVRIDRNAADPVYVQYVLTTDSLQLSTPSPTNRAPTASEIVAAARALVVQYPAVPNNNDCSWISMVIAAAAGATLTDASQSLVPTENLEGGYWRIVHRGTASTPANWLSLTQPGDIVRFDWADPMQPQHTTLITGTVGADGGVTVVDNAGTIREHVAYYDKQSVPASVTIYRITTDNLFLVETTDAPENLLGTVNGDLIRARGGDDWISAGQGNDWVVAGAGNDTLKGGAGADSLDGGEGNDVVHYDGADNLASVTGDGGWDTLLIENGAPPTGFNLAAQGFEVGQVLLTDTAGNQSWSRQEHYYNQSWQLYEALVVNDNGTSARTSVDVGNAQPWSQAITYSNASGQTTHQSVVNDNGTSQTNYFDPTNAQPWSQANTYYNTAGQTTHQSILNDDGSSRTTYFDPTNNQPWASADTFYNAATQTTLQSVANDDGTTSSQYWDTTNSQPWSTVIHYYNAAGVRTLSTGVNDDGTTFSY